MDKTYIKQRISDMMTDSSSSQAYQFNLEQLKKSVARNTILDTAIRKIIASPHGTLHCELQQIAKQALEAVDKLG